MSNSPSNETQTVTKGWPGEAKRGESTSALESLAETENTETSCGSELPPELQVQPGVPVTAVTIDSGKVPARLKKWRGFDTLWTMSLFGTAIGAGVLFLPINAGIGGIIPLLIMTVIAFPMTYFAHRGMTRFVLSGSDPEGDITRVAEEHFGVNVGRAITVLYFLAIYPILLVYSVSITNTVRDFLTHQIGVAAPPRWLLSFVLVGGLMSLVWLGEAFIVRAMSMLVFPFIVVLLALALFLIPNWSSAFFQTFSLESSVATTGHGFGVTLWLLIPVMVFSFNHSPAISSFATSNRREYGYYADVKTGKMLRAAEGLMVVVVMFFVWSCTLSLSPQDLAEAKAQNVTILTYLSNHFDSPIIAWAAPIIATVAITKSFLGHYLGAREGFNGIVSQAAEARGKHLPVRTLNAITALFMFLTSWLVSWANPSVLGMIETACGPIIAILLFLMPMCAIYKVPALSRFRTKRVSNFFIITMGLIAVTAIIYNVIHMFI